MPKENVDNNLSAASNEPPHTKIARPILSSSLACLTNPSIRIKVRMSSRKKFTGAVNRLHSLRHADAKTGPEVGALHLDDAEIQHGKHLNIK